MVLFSVGQGPAQSTVRLVLKWNQTFDESHETKGQFFLSTKQPGNDFSRVIKLLIHVFLFIYIISLGLNRIGVAQYVNPVPNPSLGFYFLTLI